MIYESDFLIHYGRSRLDGAPVGSGRWPLGSGEDPYQTNGDFASRVTELRKQGLSDKEIAKALGCKNSSDLRSQYSRTVSARRAANVSKAKQLLSEGKSQAEVARELNVNESTLRSWLNTRSEARMNAAQTTAQALRDLVNEKGMIDVGTGTELSLGISREKLTQAIDILKEEGYLVYGGGVPQVTNPGQQTVLKVLCPPGTEHREIYDYENVHQIEDYRIRTDEDGTEHLDKAFEYPKSMDSSRLMIRYRDDVAPDGHTGIEKDGTIEIRRGVADLDLGESHYAQVRILVDDNKYLKGMALYSDDLPDGVDVIFNTNKTPDQAAKVLKSIKTDNPDNPFGALLKEDGGQYHYTDENGERQLGLINKTREEGDWGEWSKDLPSQFLAKQPMALINKQLDLTKANARAEYEEIVALDNPTVKKYLLQKFADSCDGAAVDLKAAALPGQRYQVILPVSTLSDDEVYAPNFKDGTKIALIRFPHAGTFEIPILTVNNKNEYARRVIGTDAEDAIGINSKNAERLSGADYDGDTVLCIPCNTADTTVRIKNSPPLKGLENFDPKMAYATTQKTDEDGNIHLYVDGREVKRMTSHNTQMEMGVISNLIADMNQRGVADDSEEMARAVRHSMVVIDAEKHKLDYKQSEIDNNIAELKEKYQAHVDEDGNIRYGASTLITRAKSPVRVLKRKGSPKIDPDTGELIYNEVEEYYTGKDGKQHLRTIEVPLMSTVKDARELSSGTVQEEAYADYANYMKALANEARKEILATGNLKYSSEAAKEYAAEAADLKSQLNTSLKNAPRERAAQLAANSEIRALKKAYPELAKKENKKDLKKRSQQALANARIRYGAKRNHINITEKMWEAIQAGAVSNTTLEQILRFADIDQVRSYATPKQKNTVSSAKRSRIKALQNSGYTTAEIAEAVGLSTTTVSKIMNGKE